MSFPTAEMH